MILSDMDLDLRLHQPRPDVVIVRVIGAVDNFGASLLAKRVGAQLTRAGHVVIDLGDVSVLGPRGLAVLRSLRHQAMTRGTKLHITRAEHDAVRRALQSTGLDQLLSPEPTAESVIAGLPRQPRPETGPPRS